MCLLESPDTEAAMDLGASEVKESEVLYDCVICGQSGPSTEDRPTGLVVLLQASSGTTALHPPVAPSLFHITKINGLHNPLLSHHRPDFVVQFQPPTNEMAIRSHLNR